MGNRVGRAKNNGQTTKVNEALKNLTSRPAVADQMVAGATKASTKVKSGAHHLKNVFAKPLEDVESFTAPSYSKTKTEEWFLKNAILQNFVFSNMSPREMKTMIAAFDKQTIAAGTTIITQGDTGDYFYVIESGQVTFEVNGKKVGTATKGHTFGELSLLYTCPRAATVIADESCVLYRVDQRTFRLVLQTQTMETEQSKVELLKNVPFLKELEETDLNKMIGTMTPRTFKAGEYLVRKGEEGDALYVIQEGEVKVTDITIGGQTYEDQMLSQGDFFGERALITQEPRAANCIGARDGIALCIEAETFKTVMGNLTNLVTKATDRRKLAAIKVLQQTRLAPIDLTSMAELIVDQTFEVNSTILTEGEGAEAALYLVREGKVELSSTDERFNKVVESGGYFGDDMLTWDVGRGDTAEPIAPAKYTVKVLETCTLGCLTLGECRTVIDTKMIGKGKRTGRFSSVIESTIGMDQLKKHAILGAGTFGQVWLVSREASDGSRRPYALKIQSKYELVRNSQAKGVVQEKNLMSQLNHPFIIHLVNTYQDKRYVYMLLSVIQGGELFSQIHTDTFDGIPEKNSKFYAACILEALSFMHRRHILYRDLKPENVLIDDLGYPVVVDLGFAKYVTEKTYTLCGTPLYIAPEVILNRGHDKGADHWSLAVLIFEMITGNTPFYKEGMDQISLFRAIVKGRYKFPKSGVMSAEAEDICSRILITDPSRRMGSLAGGAKDIFRASWFKDIDFEALKRKEVKAPWIPKLKDPLDTRNFENWDHLDDKTENNDPPVSRKDDAIFATF